MTVDLLVRDAYVYVDRGWEIAGGWIAIKDKEFIRWARPAMNQSLRKPSSRLAGW